jgi:hypothetical protein
MSAWRNERRFFFLRGLASQWRHRLSWIFPLLCPGPDIVRCHLNNPRFVPNAKLLIDYGLQEI